MIDFKLTEIGDIDLAIARQYPSFTINLYVPELGKNKNARRYDAFRIDFDTDIPQYDTRPYGFKIDFDIDLHQPEYKIGAPPVYNNEELAQEVLIRLKTELGEFELLPSLGSQLVLERHEDIRSSVTLENVKQYVETAIEDINFPEDYTVTVERIDDISRYKYETLRITIDTGRTNIYNGTV